MYKRVGLTASAAVFARVAFAEGLPDPVTDDSYMPVRLEEATLGQLLFYDPILSGNREVSCATCHHPAFGTGDGLSLSLGDGGIGLGPERVVDPNNLPEQRVPRNAPALFNLGAHEFTTLFFDGRIEVDESRPGGLRTPLDDEMVAGFASILSAQTMFPVLSPDEMAGHYSENEVSQAVRRGVLTGPGGAWELITDRVANIDEYAQMFGDVYPHINGPEDIAFTDISNAIAVFMTHEWRSDTSPFDAVMRGELALTGEALAGMELFYGSAECVACHSGPFLTDHLFHAVGAPQVGPGKSARFEDHARDEGRMRVTGDPADIYAFRTPSLRNIELTAPYGHAGAHAELRDFLMAHADPALGLENYDPAQLVLPEMDVDDGRLMRDADAVSAIAAASEPMVQLSSQEVESLVSFLHSLTDPVVEEGRLGVPQSLPSGLPVIRPEY